MTCGKDGALVHDGKTTTMVPGVPTRAVDTTGAGDMFAGAFLYAINSGKTYEEAAAQANLAASVLVASFGARLPIELVNEKLRG
jgi:sugar/nucleoside kinase (ribokinase family)